MTSARPSGSSRTRRTGRSLVLGLRLDGRCRRRRPGAAAVRPHRLRGSRLAHRRRLRDAPAARCRTCRAARAGCSSRSPATTSARSPTRSHAPSRAGVAVDSPGRHRRRRAGRPVADPRGGRRPGDPHAAAARPLSGWEDAAVPPERLGAYLREFDALLAAATASTACPYGHFGDGCVHIRIDFPLDADGGHQLFRRVPRRRRDAGRRATAGRCRASTATAAPAPSCCR